MANLTSGNVSTISPVFLLCRKLPLNVNVDNYTLCLASAKTAGRGSLIGAQRIGALWSIYPSTAAARVVLLTRGINIAGQCIEFESQNPFTLRGSSGQEIPGTRLTISDVPLSFSNDAIEAVLLKKGFKLRSKLKMEEIRDRDGKMTEWLSGRRLVWIDLPKSLADPSLQIGPHKAKIYYREMKEERQCRKCLGKGHVASQCPHAEVCLRCKKPGHRAADCIMDDTRGRLGLESEEEFPSLQTAISADSDSEPEDSSADRPTLESVWNTVESKKKRRRRNKMMRDNTYQAGLHSEGRSEMHLMHVDTVQSHDEEKENLSTTFTIGDIQVEASSAAEATGDSQPTNEELEICDSSVPITQPPEAPGRQEDEHSITREPEHQSSSENLVVNTMLDSDGRGGNNIKPSRPEKETSKEEVGTLPHYFRKVRQQNSNKRPCPDTSTSSEGTPTSSSSTTV